PAAPTVWVKVPTFEAAARPATPLPEIFRPPGPGSSIGRMILPLATLYFWFFWSLMLTVVLGTTSALTSSSQMMFEPPTTRGAKSTSGGCQRAEKEPGPQASEARLNELVTEESIPT